MQGTLVGISRRPARRAPSETLDRIAITCEGGLDGDHRGPRFRLRQVTVLSAETWQDACADLGIAPPLDWTVRRANLLVAGLQLPRGPGSVLRIGNVGLEVTGRTTPCARMDEAVPGLLKALGRDWRGGVTCRVIEAGDVSVGDPVTVALDIPERIRRLPDSDATRSIP